MIKIKKAVALFLAIATFLSCGVAQVSATTKVNGTKIDNLIPETMYPQADGSIAKMQNVTYTSTSNAKIKYVVTTVGNAFVQIRNVNYGDGQYAMAVYGKGGGNSSNKGDSRISMFIGEKTADNKYVISFDATRSATNWQDYVALNEGGWNGTARLDDSSTQWTITDLDQSLAVNPDKYGQKANNWKHYEATLSTQNDPQIDFGVFLSENAMYVDNIVVKDTSGNVIFSENFEFNEENIYDPFTEAQYPSNETSGANHYKMQNATYTSENNANMKYVVATAGDAYVMVMNANSDNNGGTKSLRIYGKGTNISGTNSSAKISMFLGVPQTENNQYVVSFDAYRKDGTWLDYVALNEGGNDGIARFDNENTQWTKTTLGAGYDAGYNVGEWSRYTATLTTMNAPQLNFSVNEYAIMFIDNIVVWDTEGNVLFREDFEVAEEQVMPEFPVNETYDPLPKSVYPSNATSSADHVKMQNATYISESNENVKYVVSAAGDSYVMMMNANSTVNDGKYSLRLYGKGTNVGGSTGAARISFFFDTVTDNKEYVVSFDAHRVYSNWQDYVALNEGGWNGVARLNDSNTQWTVTPLGAGYDAGYNVGEWSRYTATLSTQNSPQLDFSVFESGVMYIDNIVVWDTAGNVIFREDFEVAEEQTIPDFPVIERYDPLPKSVYPSNETKDATHYKMQGTDLTYISDFDQSVKYVINTSGTTGSDSYAMMMNANSDTLGGKYAMRIYANSTNATSDNTKVSLHIGEKTADNKYIVSFDAYRNQDSKPEDYVALNGNGADGVARLDYADTQWSSTLLGAGYDAGYGVGEWSRYTAMLTTDSDDPRLDFSIAKYAVMFIDNIVVWDTAGNVIFRENFEPVEVDDMPEFPVIETYDPIPKSMYPYIKDGSIAIDKMQGTDLTYTSKFNQGVKYVINTVDNSYAQVIDVNSNDNGGKYSLRLYGKHSDANKYAKISMYLGKQTANNRYVVSFDAARFDGNDKDYAALNGSDVGGTARLGDANCQWTKTALDNSKCYDPNNRKGDKSWDWNRYTSTLTAIDTSYLEFAVFGYGLMYIDNIAVWDTQGNLIFSEDFEISEGYALPEFPGVPEEPGVITVHDAVVERVEQVENEFVATGAAGILRPNTFIRASVKIENGTDEDTSSNVYTALYRDSVLVLFDSQTVYAAAGGEMTGCAILKIPSSLEDGEYSLKVFVWDDDFNSIKDVKITTE